MSNLKVCRICLNTDVKMYNYKKYKLKNYYKQLTALNMTDKDGLPHHFCYVCATLLHKFHKFKDKCVSGQKTLNDLLHKGPITLQSISKLDRTSPKLQSSLDILTVNHRVKTYIVKSQLKEKINQYNNADIEIAYISDDFEMKDESDNIEIETKDINNDHVEDIVVSNVEVPQDLNVFTVDPKPEREEEYQSEDEKLLSDFKMESKKDKDIRHNSTDIEIASISDDNGNDSINFGIKETSDDINIETKDIYNIDPKPEGEVEYQSEDEKLLSDFKMESMKDIKDKGSRKKKNKSTGNKKKKKGSIEEKAKRFEIKDKKKTDLDPNNWLKFNLTEEQAVEEFKAKGQQKRFLSAEYKCMDCLRGFSKQDMLNRHIKLRHDESVGPIECRFCHMRFKWKCFLNKHMRQHYTKYKCLRCDLVCPLETTALFHEEYHNGVIRKCKHCGEEFKHLTTYYTHLRTHRSEHVCTLCGASFVSAIGLGIHKKIKHVNTETEAPQGEDEYCERCDIRFETRKAFEEHLIHSAKHTDGLDDVEIQLSNASNPRKRRQTLKRYTRIPTDCHICGKHFATQAACRKHHLAEHPRTSFFAPNERHICEVCGISLAPGSVTSHLNIHTREKIYNCKTCGRQFNSKGGMITHQLTHTSEKPVACTLCDKRFKQISSMRLHYRTFHLKEPYPKRNRKRKGDDISKLDDYLHEKSDEIDRWR